MNNKQIIFLFVFLLLGLITPQFSLALFFMGLAIGSYISILLKN